MRIYVCNEIARSFIFGHIAKMQLRIAASEINLLHLLKVQ